MGKLLSYFSFLCAVGISASAVLGLSQSMDLLPVQWTPLFVPVLALYDLWFAEPIAVQLFEQNATGVYQIPFWFSHLIVLYGAVSVAIFVWIQTKWQKNLISRFFGSLLASVFWPFVIGMILVPIFRKLLDADLARVHLQALGTSTSIVAIIFVGVLYLSEWEFGRCSQSGNTCHSNLSLKTVRGGFWGSSIDSLEIDTDEKAEWSVLSGQALDSFEKGDYQRSLLSAQAALEKSEMVFGESSIPTAISLNNLAEIQRSFGRRETSKDLHEQALAIRMEKLPVDNEDIAASLNNLSLTEVYHYKVDSIRQNLDQAKSIFESEIRRENIFTAQITQNIARYAWMGGDFNEALEQGNRALEIRRNIVGPYDPAIADSYTFLGEVFRALGESKRAYDLHRAAYRIRLSYYGSNHTLTAETLNNLALSRTAMRKFDRVLNDLNRALAVFRMSFPGDHPSTAQAMQNIASFYQYEGRFQEAEDLFESVLKMRKRIFGQSHPILAETLNSLGNLYRSRSRFVEANNSLLDALKLQEEFLGPDHVFVGVTLANLGFLKDAEADYQKAEHYYSRALKIYENSFGENHPNTATIINVLGLLYHNSGRYKKALPFYQRAHKIWEKEFGADHPKTAEVVMNLGRMDEALGNYLEAERRFAKANAIFEKTYGENNWIRGAGLANLAELYRAQGRFEEAEVLYKRVITIFSAVVGPDHPDTAQVTNNLGLIYRQLGRYNDAERMFLKAYNAWKEKLGDEHPITARAIGNLALLYQEQGRYQASEPLHLKVIDVFSKKLNANHPNIGHVKINLALLYRFQKKYDLAEELFRQAIDVFEYSLGPKHLDVARAISHIGDLHFDQRKLTEAESSYRSALSIFLNTDQHPDLAETQNSLAVLYGLMERYEEAEELLVQAERIFTAAFGEFHPRTNYVLHNLGDLFAAQSQAEKAEDYFSRSLLGLSEQAVVLGSAGIAEELVRRRILVDEVLPNVTNRLSEPSIFSSDNRHRLLDTLLTAVQQINGTRVGADIVQASARAGEGDVGLAALVERLEKASIDVRRIEAELEFAANLKASTERDERLERLKGELETAAKTARGIAGEIREGYPDYAELALPQGLSAEDVGDLVDEGEAVVSYAFVGKDEEEFLLAIVTLSDGSLELFKLDVTKASIEERVSKLREGVALPSGESFDASTLALDLAFDMSAAEELYGDLFRPLEEYLGTSDHVIVVADGPLESLPFNLLVSSQAPSDVSGEDLFSVYRDAAWLIDRYAISSVPSISSLKALRDRGAPKGDLPFLGIGHPSLEGKTQTAANDNNDDADVIKRITLGLGDTVDVKRVKELSPVPQTAGMLQALATALNADGSHVLLQDDAEERDLRALEQDKTLKEYQTIAFGTHALIARELRQVGLNEPALVLSPPANDTEEYDPNNDGLLRASEVVGLSLDADWVLLTACNTAAPDGTLGAEPLTGLAKSFFYAGARSLLVSHWPAEATATARLAPAMIQETNQGSSKAQALRQAMRQMKQDTTCGPNAPATQTCPENAHPALWATFTISGDAGGLTN